eukprot:comp22982_c0_seq1/m.36570 comp22982_c0_seq1/g.36570  ORF comp22982_c0_seq1/g.36570 comp22982_c0_seq1/m.36570 type:complete len:599 (-) comp22982_c0_seq1:607-2403(-)
MGDELYSIAILIDDLKSEDVQVRLNSVSRLSVVAQALGPERTRIELLPFLQESLDDEDEVLVALAEELTKFVPLVGGPEQAPALLPVLEALSTTEEAVVRDKAVQGLLTVMSTASDSQVATYAVMVKRLASAEWFTSKASSAGLFSTIYPRVDNDTRTELRRLYAALCRDETPMVRRAAAAKLGAWKLPGGKDASTILGFAEVVEEAAVKSELVPLYVALAQDDQDSVRLLSVEVAVTIARRLKGQPAEIEAQLMGPLRETLADKAWRVRYMAADRFVQLQEELGPEISKADLIPAFIKLLRDPEAEVRTAAAQHVPDFCLNLPADVREDTAMRLVLPAVKELVVDSNQHVRAALAKKIMNLSTVLGKQNTIDQLIPLFLQLLKDEFPEVRLNIISKLDAVNKVVGIELLSQALLPAIVELAEDRQWRVRLAIIEYVPLLAEQLGREFFDDKLNNLCMTWLNDCVFSIREAATENLKKLAQIFGPQWAQETIIPKVLSLSRHPNYLYRMTTLFCMNALAPVVGGQVALQAMVPVVCEMAQDSVPNVRFNVAKTLEQMANLLQDKSACADRITPTLTQLAQDSDKDVKYFAMRALLVAA